MSRVDNLHAGRGARAATLIVPAVLLILGTSGVVAKPTLGLEAARRQRAEAELREHEFEKERARAAEFERLGGIRRIEEARSAVTALVPERLSTLDMQNILVLVGRENHLAISSLEIGNPVETQFAIVETRVAAIEASVRGSGALGDVVAFIDGVQALGLATSVVESRVSRMTATDPLFEFRITFSFHYRETQDQSTVEEPAGEQ